MPISPDVGILYIVATPIGNLQDISLRALDILAKVDKIAVEDTRHSKKMLRHYNINTKCISLHEHNERQISMDLIDKLRFGSTIALISDAGTPLMSDPGYYLVNLARQQGIRVVPIPGACALIAALSVSGLPTDRFCFEGFLPAKSAARLKRLQALSIEQRTLIFYESPHRIVEMVADLHQAFGSERIVVLAKELTKIHETVFSGPVARLQEWLCDDSNHQKGEMVVLVQGVESTATPDNDEQQRLLTILLAEIPLKQAVKIAAQYTNTNKNALYKIALKLNEQL